MATANLVLIKVYKDSQFGIPPKKSVFLKLQQDDKYNQSVRNVPLGINCCQPTCLIGYHTSLAWLSH